MSWSIRNWRVWATVVVAISALFAIEQSAPGDDASNYWLIAGRLANTDTPFYVAAVDHKGPLWAWVYRLAYAVSGDQVWFWFVIAALFIGFVALTCVSIRYLIRAAYPATIAAAPIAAAVGMLLLFGPELFNKILYGRNITGALTAVAVAAMVASLDEARRRGTWFMAAAGLLFGISTQTVFTTGAPMLLLAAGIALFGTNRRRSMTRVGVFLVCAGFMFVLAPIWFLALGFGDDFRTYFWEYNQAYANGTSISLAQRIVDAAVELGSYHIRQIYPLAGPIAALGLIRRFWRAMSADGSRWRSWRSWNRADRVGALALLWWVGELVSVSAPGRYFGHYFILLIPPTAVMMGILIAPTITGAQAAVNVGRSEDDQLRGVALFHRLPVGTKLLTMPLVGLLVLAMPTFAIGVGNAAGYRGPEQHQIERAAGLDPGIGSVRAIVETYTSAEEPIFVWSDTERNYTKLNRRSATRFGRRLWLTGEMYGTTARAFMPQTWTQTIADLEQSRPKVFVENLDQPLDIESAVGRWIQDRYEPVYLSHDPLAVRVWVAQTAVPIGLGSGDIPMERCWPASEITMGSIGLGLVDSEGAVQAPAGSIAVDAATEEVAVRRFGFSAAVEEDGNVVRTSWSPGGSVLRLAVFEHEAILWQGTTIVAAVHLPHGIDAIEVDGHFGSVADASCGSPAELPPDPS